MRGTPEGASTGAPGFGVMLSTFDSMGAGISAIGASARRAEDLGFDSLWVGDHLFFHCPNLDALTALAAAAGATSRIGLGTGVLLVALRDPIVLAKQLGALQHVSCGRLIMGVGVGGEFGPEWEAVGVASSERGRRTDEALDVLDRLFSGDAVSYRSRHYQVEAPAMLPAPVPPIPLWVGGRSNAALRRTVDRAVGWLGVWASSHRIAEVRTQLDGLSHVAGRAVPPRIALMVFVNINDRRSAESAAERFVRGHYALPYERMRRWFLCGPPEVVAEALHEYRQAGVDDFVIFPAAPRPPEQYERVAEVRDSLQGARQ